MPEQAKPESELTRPMTILLEQDAYDLLTEHYNQTGYQLRLIVSDCIRRVLENKRAVRAEIGRPRPRAKSKRAGRAKSRAAESAA